VANKIILKNGTGTPQAGTDPDEVAVGEVAVSTDQKKIYTNVSGTITEIGVGEALPKSGGTMSGEITMGNNHITGVRNLAFDSTGSDAVSKIYDEDDMATNSNKAIATQQSIKAYVDASPNYTQYIRHIMNVGWYSSNGSLDFLPLTGYIYEQDTTIARNESVAFVAPYDGLLEKVIVRSEAACGPSTVGFHKSATGTETPNQTPTEWISLTMGYDDTAYSFAFTGTSSFDMGDILAISFDPNQPPYDTVATIIWKFDTTT